MTLCSQKPPVLPPAMLGILGGGQLGRMFAVAAKTMGYGVTVLDPDPAAPAAAFADVHLCAPFDDAEALSVLSACAAVTTEFENVSADAMRYLEQFTAVSPAADCVAVAQDRESEKARIRRAGLPTAPYQVIRNEGDIGDKCLPLLPGILKTATLGYDGKGQVPVNSIDELKQAFAGLNRVRCVLEQKLPLYAEISVIVCRSASGESRCFPPAENLHENGILAYSSVPASLPAAVVQKAEEYALLLAEELGYVGVLAVELFVPDDDTMMPVVNEIAPRPHNSGHYTLDACLSDQFQQQVRMMCGLPPAQTDLLTPCCMANLLGDVWQGQDAPDWSAVLSDPAAHLHLYGKKEARKGRKMGHFTVLSEGAETALQTARAIHGLLAAGK